MRQDNVVRMIDDEYESGQAPSGDPFRYAADLAAFIEEQKQAGTPISQAEIARRVGYSTSVISQYLREKYKQGDLEKVNERIGEFLRLERAYRQFTPQITAIATTRQVYDTMLAIEFIERHKSFGIIVGEAGVGKSKGMELYAKEHRSTTLWLIMDRLKRSPTSFVQALWSHLPGKTRGDRVTLPKASFLLDDIILHFREQPRTLLIDEAQFLSMDALETARSIQDQTKIGIVLGGTFDLDYEIGFGGPMPINAQLLSRVRVHRRLSPQISLNDLTAVVQLYGVKDRDVIDWLHQHCNRPGRRYRWVDAMLNAAHDYSIDHQCPLDVSALEYAAQFTGLL